ncbi:UNVERIFIED_CONTAM: Copia protein [Sesamum calycinum]|uniref:Copia protein n=1 Tax=Sesamum calycinum TaxID=2727403 RepID=A0AAW2SGQ3_9LAMI
MKRLVDSKSLEIDNLDKLPAYVCGPLNTQARGGFSYFITLTNDHSCYGYVYLMRYKSEVFVRFKEFRSARVPQPLERYGFLGVTAWYDYEIWQMDVTTPFLNSFVEEEIYMDQPEGFTVVGEEQKNDFDPCVYKKVSGSSVVFLVLYVDDILLIINDIKMLWNTKAWLSTQFSMKDLSEASYILGIKIIRDRSKRILGMIQNSYVEKVLKMFKMENSKRGFLPMRDRVKLSKKHSPKIDEELKRMVDISCASVVGSIQEFILEGFSDANFQSDDDDAKSQSRFVFKLNGGVVAWKSSNQDTTVDSTMEAQAKEPRSHHRSKYILKQYHLLREMVGRADVRMDRVSSAENTADPLTKPVSQIAHAQHLGEMGLRQNQIQT